jgi:ABC-type multidrug transport system fused ATPase/permease subunit
MKFTAATKAKPIVGFFFLMYLLSGCGTQISYAGSTLKCNEAENAVNQAQQEYDEAMQALPKAGKDKNAQKKIVEKVKNLLEAEENALQICNRVSG